uniref:Uncharacterized protein n=1 Tax=Anopheles dirus TaxID=7168 RepID=A0A182NJV0_9DIPT
GPSERCALQLVGILWPYNQIVRTASSSQVPSVMSRFVQVLVLAIAIASVWCQDTSNDASTVSPQDIYDLTEEDFQIWLSGRQPKAWESGSSSASSSTTTSAPPTTTPPSVFRTTTTSTTPSFLTTTPSPDTDQPFDLPSDGKSWFGEEDTVTPRPDVLGEQFKPAGEDFAQWLNRQMNRVQEVTFVPQTTLAGDQLQGAGLVTRLTTIRNRIPVTTFRPAYETDLAPVTTAPQPPPPPPPAPAPVAPAHTATGHGGAPGQLDLHQWLRDQLQTSQQLTGNLLAQWTPGGSIVRSDGHHYTPNAVSFQSSALIHGLQGVSHSGHVRNSPVVAVHPHNPPTPHHIPGRRVFYPAGSFFYSQPQPAPVQYGSFVGHFKTPLVIKY